MIGTLRERMMLRAVVSVPGMRCVYYADEAGLEGCADPFCRRTYPWGREDEKLVAYYRRMIALRRAHPCCARASAATWRRAAMCWALSARSRAERMRWATPHRMRAR